MPHTFPVPLKRPATGLVAGVVLAVALAVLLVLAGGDTALAAAAPANPSSGGGGADPFKNLYTNVSTLALGALGAFLACALGWRLLHNVMRPAMGALFGALFLGAIASYFILDHTEGIRMLKDGVASLTR